MRAAIALALIVGLAAPSIADAKATSNSWLSRKWNQFQQKRQAKRDWKDFLTANPSLRTQMKYASSNPAQILVRAGQAAGYVGGALTVAEGIRSGSGGMVAHGIAMIGAGHLNGFAAKAAKRAYRDAVVATGLNMKRGVVNGLTPSRIEKWHKAGLISTTNPELQQ